MEVDWEIGTLLDALGDWHPATRAHSERAATFVAQLATLAGWRGDAIAALRRAALLHDIGKLRIPTAILDKPGPLDPHETVVMRRHVWFSARISSRLTTREQAAWIAGHHERPDGYGYPRGLHEPAIHEGAALLALADAWDVMTNARPYCRPLSTDEALKECTALVGRQFTVQAVQALHGLHLLEVIDPESALVA